LSLASFTTSCFVHGEIFLNVHARVAPNEPASGFSARPVSAPLKADPKGVVRDTCTLADTSFSLCPNQATWVWSDATARLQ
jgi:hypothetical protein